jgi:hypothetical protein
MAICIAANSQITVTHCATINRSFTFCSLLVMLFLKCVAAATVAVAAAVVALVSYCALSLHSTTAARRETVAQDPSARA